MNSEALLSQLRPLHAPDPVSWWPPAPGWIALFLLTMLTLILLAIWFYQTYQSRAWKRAALKQLNHLASAQQKLEAADTYSELSRLIRRCIALSEGNPEALAYAPTQFSTILQAPKNGLSETLVCRLSEGQYQASPDKPSTEDFKAIRRLIRSMSA